MLEIQNKHLLAIDLETSGINPFRHEVLAVAMVPVSIRRPPLVLFIRPPAFSLSDYAKPIFEKYRLLWQAQAMSPKEACTTIEHYLYETFSGQQATVVGHNVAFDLAFLQRLAFLGERLDIAGLSHRSIDTHSLLYLLHLQGKIPAEALTSDGAFAYFGIQVNEKLRHTALEDATATRELFLQILSTFGDRSMRFDANVSGR